MGDNSGAGLIKEHLVVVMLLVFRNGIGLCSESDGLVYYGLTLFEVEQFASLSTTSLASLLD